MEAYNHNGDSSFWIAGDASKKGKRYTFLNVPESNVALPKDSLNVVVGVFSVPDL